MSVENTGGWTVNPESGPFRIIENPNKMILRIHDDGTVELGAGVSLADASKAFWEYIQVHGPKAQLAQARALLERLVPYAEDIDMDQTLADEVRAFLAQ